jgi:hypothetical protein
MTHQKIFLAIFLEQKSFKNIDFIELYEILYTCIIIIFLSFSTFFFWLGI